MTSDAPEPLTPELESTIAEIFGRRDREHMQPTIEAFLALLAGNPGQPEVLYEVGGSYDTAGEEETALGYYEAALAAGLTGDTLRRCLLQYGSTLRLLGRYDESLAALDRALEGWPESRRCGRSTRSRCTRPGAATARSASCSRSSPTASARPTCCATRPPCTATPASSSGSTPSARSADAEMTGNRTGSRGSAADGARGAVHEDRFTVP